MPDDFLDLADFVLIAEAVTGINASVLRQSDHVVSRAESALGAPRASYGGEEFYPAFEQKAAILCSRIIRNHPLPDGNKRAAFLCLVEFIERNGREWLPPESGDDEVVDTIMSLASRDLSEERFVDWVRQRIGDHT